MSIWQLIRLDFGRNTAHFGELGIGMEKTSERVYSDTLFSAWMTSYARLFGSNEVKKLLKNFPIENDNQIIKNADQIIENDDQSPPFSLSSTFIYSTEDQEDESRYIYYLPKPLVLPKEYPVGNDLEFNKSYKKLKYLPLYIWRRWYQQGGFTDSDKLELIENTQKTKDKSGCLYKAGVFSYSETYKTQRVPKVAIDRITHATNIYYTGFVQYQWESKKQSGLYFLIHFPEENTELQQRLKASLYLLGEEGIGGERSSGAGCFTAKWHELPNLWKKVINFKSSETVNHALISLFWEKSLSCTPLSYSIIERGGWVSSSGQQERRRKVRMLGEGSVFSDIPKGQLANVTPKNFSHKVYRSGISSSIPIIIQSQES